ncbi:MAG: hypothetical protein R2745_26355 [Vicinamibacterales bacterium]
MPTARRCTGCGAALGEPTDDDLTILCTFCGLRHDINALGSAGPAPVVIELGPGMRRTNGLIVGTILAIVALSVAGGLYVSYRAATEVTTRVTEATRSVQARAAERRRALAPAELSGLTEFAWKTLDVPPPPGGFAAFDPVASLPWALDIAHAWATDAVVTRIDVDRVAATGVVALDGEATSGYRFASPARTERAARQADTGVKGATSTGMMMQLRGSEVRVLMETDRVDDVPPTAAASLPLGRILERARRGRGFGDRPFYAGYLILLPREGWVWYFRSLSGESFPRVRARDGRVYPY